MTVWVQIVAAAFLAAGVFAPDRKNIDQACFVVVGLLYIYDGWASDLYFAGLCGSAIVTMSAMLLAFRTISSLHRRLHESNAALVRDLTESLKSETRRRQALEAKHEG